MTVTETALPGVLLLTPRVFGDDRGWFMESFNQARFDDATGSAHRFVQDNQSFSRRGVLRGLHYQIGAHPQGKLVRALAGEIFDVAVDIRRGSPRFGQWTGARLSAENRHQLWVPAGFAHAFLVLSETAEVLYKTTDVYDPGGERAIVWNDPDIGIAWPLADAGITTPTLADKDAAAPGLSEAEVFP